MTDTKAILTEHSRCLHITAGGRRCRLRAQDHASGLCFRHAQLLNRQSDSADLSSELTAGLVDFKSAAPINDFLSRLLRLQVQGRIAPRRAAVMAFNCNLLLHSLSAIARETKVAEDETPIIIWDIPGVDPLRGRNSDLTPNPTPGQAEDSTLTPESALDRFRSLRS